jgi:hypothetical protein
MNSSRDSSKMKSSSVVWSLLPALPRPAAAAAARAVELVALLVFLVAGVDGFPHAAVGVAEIRFVHVLDGNRDLFAVFDIGDRAALDRASDRVLDLAL